MRYFALLLSGLCCAAPTQITIGSTNKMVLSGGLPASPPYSTLTTWHIDWRVTIPAAASAGWSSGTQSFLDINSFAGYRVRPNIASAGVSFTYLVNGPGVQFNCPNINFAQDTVIRLQKNATNLTCETWNVDGSNYQIVTSGTFSFTGLAGTFQVGDATNPLGTLAFLRGYSGTVALNSKPPFGGSGGDLWDYEFTNSAPNSITDASGNSLTLTGTAFTGTGAQPTPTGSYSQAATYAPACIIPAQTTFRAGSMVTGLTGAGSYPLNGSSTLAYQWQQLPGNITITPPSTLLWSSPTNINPTIQGFVTGSYTIQLTVIDSSGTSTSCSQKYGAVATDTNGSVPITNALHQKLIGPVMGAPGFSSDWPSYVLWAKEYARNIIGRMAGTWGGPTDPQLTEPWNVAQTGTVTTYSGTVTSTSAANSIVTWVSGSHFTDGGALQAGDSIAVNGSTCTFTGTVTSTSGTCTSNIGANASPVIYGSTTVTGLGTAFKSLYCNGGTSPNSRQPYIVVWYFISTALYPSGTVTGRRSAPIVGCRDDTHLTASFQAGPQWISQTYVQAGTGLGYAYMDLGLPGIPDNSVMSFEAWGSGGTASPGNYYDNVMAFYYLWYATGIDDYLQAARTLADRWWSYPGGIDKGVFGRGDWSGGGFTVRSLSLLGLYMRNADNPPIDMWPGLTSFANNLILSGVTGTCNVVVGPTILNCGFDIREGGWGLRFVAIDALYNPSPSQVTADLAAITRDLQNKWTPLRTTTGYWQQLIPQTPQSYTSPTQVLVTITTGSDVVTAVSPIFDSSWTGLDFMPTTNGTTEPISNAGGDSTWYYVKFVDSTHLQLVDVNGVSAPYTGSLSGSGRGWATGNLLMGLEPWMEGMLSDGFNMAAQSLAATSPTNAALYNGYVQDLYNYQVTIGMHQPDFASWYFMSFLNMTLPGVSGGFLIPNATYHATDLNDQMGTYSNIYALNPGTPLKTFSDNVFSAMFACTSSDQGFATFGPGICAELAPGTGTDWTSFPWKYFGQYFGTGAGWRWGSIRIGGLTPANPKTYNVGYFMPANGASVTITIETPDGVSHTPTVCSASANAAHVCATSGYDATQSSALMMLTYKNGGGTIIATSSLAVPVQVGS